ncbi:MAG: rhomboid family intramembrane serine protease [Gammaproteobacteria bacterium]
MFFLPLDRMPDWRNPPLITLLLLVINVLCWYIWQANDNAYLAKALDYYQYSRLYIPELKAFDEYRHIKDKLTKTDLDKGTSKAKKRFTEMFKDGEFQNKLDADQIIKPDDSGYSDWRSKRNQYDYLRSKVVSYEYGTVPSRPSLLTDFTGMFLHGSNSHLWGNMVFLVLLGYAVELILGPVLFLAGYLLSGLAANWLYIMLYPHSAIPGVGASGAIAGIMGMYVIIFGLRKVNFFYYVFVYFDYVRAPAILMLPFFLAYQAIIQFLLTTNVNTAAHVGGIFAGALFAGILKFVPGAIKTEYVDEKNNEDKFQAEYQQAMQLMTSMKIDEAREKFEALLKQRPDDINLKQQLYNVCKYNTASEPYHRYAAQLLNLPGSDQTTVKIIHDTFVDYAARAKPKPRWSPALLMSMATRFAASGYMEDAEKLVNFMLKARSDYNRIPEGLAALAKYFKGRDKQKVDYYSKLLLQRYPESNEAQHLLKANQLSVSD